MMRLLVTVIVVGIPMSIRFLGSALINSVNIKYDLPRAYMYMIFEYILPFFIASFMAFGFVRLICHKLNIDNSRA